MVAITEHLVNHTVLLRSFGWRKIAGNVADSKSGRASPRASLLRPLLVWPKPVGLMAGWRKLVLLHMLLRGYGHLNDRCCLWWLLTLIPLKEQEVLPAMIPRFRSSVNLTDSRKYSLHI
jgi:hypothetical protein